MHGLRDQARDKDIKGLRDRDDLKFKKDRDDVKGDSR